MLYLIPTPIGNIDDITIRAVKLLSELRFLICEDTRSTKKLLNLLQIDYSAKKFYSLTSFVSDQTLDFFTDLITKENIGLVSDAGSPGLSDPGKSMIEICNDRKLPFTVLPGANALLPAVIASGFDTSSFVFVGFLPKKKGRQTMFRWMLSSANPVFFYESVHRISKTIIQLQELGFLGKVSISREISKMHEQIITDDIAVIIRALQDGTIVSKGEFVVGIYNTTK